MRVKANLIALVVGLTTSVCAMAQTDQEQVLMTIENDAVTLGEFESIYKKNNTNAAVDQKSLDDYLELFINFKLKVKEAEALGLDTVGSFEKELAGYRKQLAQPYLVDRKVNDDLIREAYDRMKEDVNASHVLIKVDAAASPRDTLVAYKKTMSIRNRLLKNRGDFAELAKRMSDDPSAKENGGNLGYFSALQMVYPFESAAFSTEVGEISMPVRTRFGYHLLKVNDRRPARGSIRVAHIMVKTSEDFTPEQHAQAKQKIDELYQQVKGGEAFEKIARLYSDDKTSAKKGGELPVFATGRMVIEFEDAAFALENDDDISEPVNTSYGWHIIRRIERIAIGDFEDLEADLKRRVKRDGRGNKGREALLRKIKSDYGYAPNMAARDQALSYIDTTYLKRKWTIESAGMSDLNKELFTLTDPKGKLKPKKITQADLADFMQEQMKRTRTRQIDLLRTELWTQFSEDQLLAYENKNLENKYPEFKALVQEYRDGILLFELMDQKVWSKAVKDTAGLETFYEGNKNQFLWDTRLAGSIYTCASDDIAVKAKKMALKRAKKKYTDQQILDKINKDSQLALKMESGKFLKGDNDIIDNIDWEKGVTDFKPLEDKVVFVEVRDVIESEPKSLQEARGLVTAQYQTYLEETWIKELRDKYTVKVNREVLGLIK